MVKKTLNKVFLTLIVQSVQGRGSPRFCEDHSQSVSSPSPLYQDYEKKLNNTVIYINQEHYPIWCTIVA